MKDATKMFRQWKTDTTRKHIFNALEKRPDEFPPRKPYGFEEIINDEQWLEFVNSRLTPEWKDKRLQMQEYRRMNKYNHNLSRGGYVHVEEMLQQQTGQQLSDIDRADLWTMGRPKNKEGELIGEAAEVQKNIVSFYIYVYLLYSLLVFILNLYNLFIFI